MTLRAGDRAPDLETDGVICKVITSETRFDVHTDEALAHLQRNEHTP